MMATVFPHDFRDGRGNVASGQQVMDNLDALRLTADAAAAAIAAKWAAGDLQASLAEQLSVSAGGVVRRGKAVIPGEETYSGAVFGTLPTPDSVTVTLPADGLVHVMYQAVARVLPGSVGASVAIFVNGSRLKIARAGGPGDLSAATVGPDGGSGAYGVISSSMGGLRFGAQSPSYPGDVTTGQVLGIGDGTAWSPALAFFGAAGSYTVSVQYQIGSGTVAVRARRLLVRAEAF